jgi:hypothetical protein
MLPRLKAKCGSLYDANMWICLWTLPSNVAPTGRLFGYEIDLAHYEQGDMNDGLTIVIADNQQGNRALAVLCFVNNGSPSVVPRARHDDFVQDLHLCGAK